MRCAARRVWGPVAACCMLALGAAAGAGDNPASLLAAAAGHPAQRHLQAQTTRTHGSDIERATLDVQATTRLERRCQAELCQGNWFDGAQSYAFGINGTPFPDRESDNRALRTFAAIASTAFAEPAFLTAGGRVSAVAGADPSQVRFRVTAPGGSELIAIADARTYRLEAVEHPDGSAYATLVASGTAPALVYAARAYERVAVLPEPLAAPSVPRVRFAGAADVPLLSNTLPIVPCRLAGRDATCLIDSGSTPSAVTLAFAERLEREPRGTLEVNGLGSYLTGAIDAGPLEIGGATVEGLHFAVVPHARGPAFDVIVGSDVLGAVRIEFDPNGRRVRIADQLDDAPDAHIGLDFDAGLPFANVRLGDRLPVESMLLDTGDTGTVSIGYDEYRADLTLFAVRTHTRAAGAGAATMDALEGELAHIDVSDTHLERVPIAAVRGQHQGHLGFGFIARCRRFVLDLGARRSACLATAQRIEGVTPGQR